MISQSQRDTMFKNSLKTRRRNKVKKLLNGSKKD